MLATSHTIVAALITVKFADNLPLAASLITTSHFLLDMIPHWDFGTDWKKRSKMHTGMYSIIETVSALLLSIILFSQSLDLFLILFAFTLGNLPDWLQAPWYIWFAKQEGGSSGNKKSILYKIFYFIDKAEDPFHTVASFPFGVVTQVVSVVFFWVLLF